jgi:steroid 5-alpha reductase family enzyme
VLIGLAAVIALFTILWIVSLLVKNSSIVDMWWGPGILLIGLTYAFTSNGTASRGKIVVAMLIVWAIRLAWHIGARNIGHGEDFRYAKWRRERGASWWWFSYFKVFLLQAVIAWIISMPIYSAVTSREPIDLNAWDYAGAILFVIGFLFEAIGDEQLRGFKSNPANKGHVLDSGLWRYTRHPNYFGEAVLWWGFALFSIAAGGYAGVIGPAIMTFLLIRVSGVALLEKTLAETKPGYAEYIANTPAFLPRWRRPGSGRS